MGSGFATVALRRRFLLGPLIALALVGADPAAGPIGFPVGAGDGATSEPTSAAGVEATVRALLLAMDAERVYYVDNLVFAAGVGAELETLRVVEPGVAWGTAVVVEVPLEEGAESSVAVLRAPLPGGGSLCVAEVTTEQDAGTWFSRAAAGSDCPAPSPGMRGWSTDQASGWA